MTSFPPIGNPARVPRLYHGIGCQTNPPAVTISPMAKATQKAEDSRLSGTIMPTPADLTRTLAPEQLAYARRRLAFLEASDPSLLVSLLDGGRLTTQLFHDGIRAANVVRRETQRGETKEAAEKIAVNEVLEPRDQLGFHPAAADMERAKKLLEEWKKTPEGLALSSAET